MFRFKSLNIHLQILLALLTVFILQSTILLIKDPPIWPDEAIYADIAINWLNEKRLGPDIWLDAYPGATEHFYSYPPIFLLIVATYFKTFGTSIETQRLISQTAAIIFLFVFLCLFKSISQNKKVHFLLVLPLIGLVLDPFFSQASRIARPEMTVTLIGSLGFLAYIKAKNSNGSLLLFTISGLLISFSFLTHFLGGMIFTISVLLSFLLQEKFNLIKSKSFYVFIFSFLILPSFYLLSVLPNLDVFKYQLLLYAGTISEYFYFVLKLVYTSDILPQILITTYATISVIFIIKTIKSKTRELTPFAVILSVSWIVSVYSKEVWYFFYVIPWIYLAAAILLQDFATNYFRNFLKLQKRKFLHLMAIEGPIILIILMFLAVFLSTFRLVNTFWGDKYSYHLFVKSVLSTVPESKTVFLSSIPDPYFGFKSQGRKNTLYEFPVVQIEKEKFLNLLNNSDYIVFNGVYNSMTELLPAYINKNTQNTTSIGSENQYKALIIELKPRNQRETP